MTTYVGIDQSYSGFGLTFLKNGEHTTTVTAFPPGKHGTGIDRLLAIRSFMVDAVSEWGRDNNWDYAHICMEGYAAGSKFGREAAGELGAMVKWALVSGIGAFSNYGPQVMYPTIVPPTSLKKFVTGKGNSAKSEILLGVYKKWGATFFDDNAADSYGLARIAEALVTKTQYEYETEVVRNLTMHTEKPEVKK